MVLGVVGSLVISLFSAVDLSGVIFLFLLSMPVLLESSLYSMGGVWWVDGLSQVLIVLALYISILMVAVSMKVSWVKSFISCIYLVCLFLILSFSAVNVFFFYSVFEGVLIPTMMMILGWGYQPERVQAVVYMVAYTVIGSLPFLYGMALLFTEKSVLVWGGVWSQTSKSLMKGSVLYVLGFLVKLPVFPFYLWLPKAHVEAPLAGSMVLAALLLKLGGYGLIRVNSLIVSPLGQEHYMLFVTCGIMGGAVTSLMCLQQSDLKALVAFSSIGHMSLVFLGGFSNHTWGLCGAVALMVGHGLCSSGMFVSVDAMYQVSGSRSMIMNKGFLVTSPVFSVMFFMLVIGNIPAPLSLNLFGEMLVMSVGAVSSLCVVVLLVIMSFLSGCFNLYIYSSTQHGKVSGLSLCRNESGYLTMLVLICHWVPLNLLIFVFPWVICF